MNPRNRLLALLALFGLCLAGLTVFVFLGQGPRRPGAPAASGIGGPFRLTAQDGTLVTDKDLLGGPALVFFGFTHCPDVCPTTLFELSEVFAKLGKNKKIAGIFITVDPGRDTPAALKDYLASFDPRIRGLSGDPAAIDNVKKAYRVYAKRIEGADGGYTYDHTALVYLIDKEGRFVNAFNLDRRPEEAAKELAAYF